MLRGLNAFDLDRSFQVTRLGEVKGHLHTKPGFWSRAERFRQPVGHLDGNGRLFIHEIGKCLASDAKPLRSLGDRQVRGLRQSSRTIAPGCTGFFIAMSGPPNDNPDNRHLRHARPRTEPSPASCLRRKPRWCCICSTWFPCRCMRIWRMQNCSWNRFRLRLLLP